MKNFSFTHQTTEKVLQNFNTAGDGLTEQEAHRRLKKFGFNETGGHQIFWWQILGRQFKSPFIYLLLIAALITIILNQFIDAAVIILFISINAFLGFYQEFRSEQSLKLLKRYIVAHAKIFRDGAEAALDAKQIVPGDVLVLETGDQVPADLRLIDTDNLIMDESTLTGESINVAKTSAPLKKEAKNIYEATNMVFAGTKVTNGRGKGIVVETGMQTQIGEITKLTVETSKESLFAKEISSFSKFILRLTSLTIVFIFIANIVIKGGQADIPELLIFSIALAIGVIPEALPVVITLSLSRGALKLARKKVVVKRLSAIEDLGSIQILCTDKTGTLTENVLTVDDMSPLASPEIFIYANLATTSVQKKKTEPFDIALWEKLTMLEKRKINQASRLDETPFDPRRRCNTVLVKSGNKQELIVRGAPETVLNLCGGLTDAQKNEIIEWVARSGRDGKRVLALAKKIFTHNEIPSNGSAEKNLEFLGAISFIDPIKHSTRIAIEQAKKMGIQLKIITGDNKEVAGAVAHKIGLIESPDDVMTGEELLKLPREQQQEIINRYHVFARITPEEKYAIIKLLQEQKEIGFLGEGINDAPALKIAEVSLVVAGASDIARESADIILLQKDLRVIIEGIKQGREVFSNTVKYIKATMASNFGNFYAVAISSLFINYLPILPLQILLINLLSDFPMIAIATDNVDPSEIAKPQKNNLKDIIFIATLLGLVSTVFDFLFFAMFYRISPAVLQTNWFMGSILTELVFLFTIRTKLPFYKARIPSAIVLFLTITAAITTVILPYTQFGQKIFHFTPPTMPQLQIILIIVGLYFICSEIVKLTYYRFFGKQK